MAQQARTGDATDTDELVQQAVDELYSIEPDDFMARRADLVAAAKAAKDREAAKRITALRKPTRSAYAVNRMVRREPEPLDALLELSDELRQAERSVDAPRVRELSKQRRRLIDDVARRALEEGDPTAVRDEVVSTLQAALADEDVAEQVRSGSLVRAATFEGFGFPGAPDLSVVRSPRSEPGGSGSDRRSTRSAASEKPADLEAPSGSAAESAADDQVEHESAGDRRRREAEHREQERARRKAQDEAMAVLERAEDAATGATRRERDLRKRIRELEDELYEVRRELDDARAEVKRTAAEQREARLAVDRLD